MSRFVDVQPYHWFYDNVEEACDLTLKDGDKFLRGIAYNMFEEGKQAVDYVYADGTAHSEKTINYVIKQTDDNPLIAFVDGISVAIDDVTPNSTNGTTHIKFKRMIPANSQVRIVFGGEPLYMVFVTGESTSIYNTASLSDKDRTVYRGEKFEFVGFDGVWFKVKDYITAEQYVEKYIYLDSNVYKKPDDIGGEGVWLPSASLDISGDFQYVYDPYNHKVWEKLVCNGIQLKRVQNYSLVKENDEYAIENGNVYVHYDLNNSIVEGTVLTRYDGETKPKYIKVKPYSSNILYNNRFFPDCEMLRVEFMVLLNRLRMYFYYKYSDSEAPRHLKTTSRFDDVNDALNAVGEDPWWWVDFRDIEDLLYLDGTYLFEGVGDNKFGIDRTITRAECVVLMNRFRKVMVEAFK